MPRIRCKCGEIINLSGIPSENQSLMISDVEFDEFFVDEVDSEKLYNKMKIVVHCNNCKRLYVYYDGFDKEPTIYKEE